MPNHLTQQTAAEFLRLYPAADILVTTKRDFETRKRKKFCGSICLTVNLSPLLALTSAMARVMSSIWPSMIFFWRS